MNSQIDNFPNHGNQYMAAIAGEKTHLLILMGEIHKYINYIHSKFGFHGSWLNDWYVQLRKIFADLLQFYN